MNRIIVDARLRSRLIAWTLGAAVAASCSEGPAGPAALTVASTTPAAGAQSASIETTVRLEFSAPLNPATVTSSSVKVEAAGTPVVGTLAVNGSTVTFTPAELLTERGTTYTVTVTTGVRAESGGRLAADVVTTFTTVFWDPAYYYRLTNAFQGPTVSLDTFSGSYHCFMGDTGAFSGQFWYFTAIAGTDGYYSMRNAFQGEALALEGANAPDRCLLGVLPPPPAQFYTGQMWKAVAFGSGYRLQNLYLGAARSLDVIDDGTGVFVPMMVDTGAFSGQVWFFTRLSKR